MDHLKEWKRVALAERSPLVEGRFKLASVKHEKTTGINNYLMETLLYH